MQPLKKRLRPDNIPSEQRVMRGRTGRTIYLLLLSVFGLTVINYMFGDYVLLEADGLVLRDQHVVATTYVARVDGVDVTEGQAVEAGNPLVKLQSTEILERLADLSTKRAELVAKETDFKVKAASVAQLLPLAERRVAEAVNTIKQFDTLAAAKLVTAARYQEALRVNYEASHDRVNLITQRQVLEEELSSLDDALADADDAIAKLKGLYADGMVRSPVSGSIGASVPFGRQRLSPWRAHSVHLFRRPLCARLPAASVPIPDLCGYGVAPHRRTRRCGRSHHRNSASDRHAAEGISEYLQTV